MTFAVKPQAKKLLAEIARGAELALMNANQLCKEAELLRNAGSFGRAVFLHQISMEECGKVDIIGEWAIVLLLGEEVDLGRMTRAIRSHEAKNHANAYYATVPDADREKDRGAAAFERFQAKFHREANAMKNASMYVDFDQDQFVAPQDVIPEELAIGMAAVNRYFLQMTGARARLLRRMQRDDGSFAKETTWFVDRLAELSKLKPGDREGAYESLMAEMAERFVKQAQSEKSGAQGAAVGIGPETTNFDPRQSDK